MRASKLALTLSVSILIGCTESAEVSDRNFIEPLLKENVKLGMTASEIAQYFQQYQPNFEFSNLCTKLSEKTLSACEQGYIAVGIIPLPSKNLILGQGQAQVYLTFSQDQVLTASSVEVYYENQHQ